MLSLLSASTSYVVPSPGMMTPATCTSRTAAPTMFWGQLAQADIVGIDARKQPAPLMRSNTVVERLASVIAQAEIVGIDGTSSGSSSQTRMPNPFADAVADAALALRIGM